MPSSSVIQRLLVAALLLGSLAILLEGVTRMYLPGWDESEHGLYALTLAHFLRHGQPGGAIWTSLAPSIYPPLGRFGMALGFLFDGAAFGAPRAASAVAWILAVFFSVLIARRLVEKERADAASFWTALFGVTSWLGSTYASTAMLEPWSALSLAAAVWAYLRACESGTVGRCLLLGLLAVAAVLVKYNYGLILGATLTVSALAGREIPLKRLLVAVAPAAVILFWWFVWPYPGAPSLGTLHRESMSSFVAMSAEFRGLAPYELIHVYSLEGCVSLPAFFLVVAGAARGAKHWRNPAARVCLLLSLAGVASVAAYPYRVDRFLIPTLLAGWPLGGAMAAVIAGRRLPVAAALLALVLLTPGIGASTWVTLTSFGAFTFEEGGTHGAMYARRARNPYGSFKRPFGAERTPQVKERLLDFIARTVDPKKRFAWIGGVLASYSLRLTCWRLYQVDGEFAALGRADREAERTMEETDWDEEKLRAWASKFPLVVTIDPPVPDSDTFRLFEKDLVYWMARHDGFRVKAEETFLMEDGVAQKATVYERR